MPFVAGPFLLGNEGQKPCKNLAKGTGKLEVKE
jgi:hypothetical protein